MTLSQNGWPAYATTEHFTRFTAAGVGFWAANADAAYAAGRLITEYNARVEKILGVPLDDWSWADRLVRGSTATVSNHGSATAWDLNATKHPRGTNPRNNFTNSQIDTIHDLVEEFSPVFRWGGDYVSAEKDGMHWEINVSAAALKAWVEKDKANMALSDDDVKKIWFADIIPDDNDPKNPSWMPQSELRHIKSQGDSTAAAVDAMSIQLKALAVQAAQITAMLNKIAGSA